MSFDSKIISLGLILLHVLQFSALYAQEGYDGSSFETESEAVESVEGADDTGLSPAPADAETTGDQSDYSTDPAAGGGFSAGDQISSGADESGFQNAIIEGVQLTAEQGSVPDEKIIAGYFIFRDKPSSYFYEVKLREKKLIFEFNDTRVGSSPVPTASEAPIKGFIIEQGKIDVNKAVKGLKPEWHDLIRVVFDLEAVPDVHVNDEYSIISFSFKWTSDPSKLNKYTVKDQTPKVILWSSAGVGGVALGAVAYLFLRPKDEVKPLKPLDTDDLPVHQF